MNRKEEGCEEGQCPSVLGARTAEASMALLLHVNAQRGVAGGRRWQGRRGEGDLTR